MRFTTSSAALLAAAASRVAAQDSSTTGELGDAIPVENNPPGAVYKAVFGENPFFTPDTPAGGPVVGEFSAVTAPDGVGVMFKVALENLPTEGGPFSYHVHVDPVPEEGNCTLALAHLDPFIRGEDPVCDPEAPETCQVGDLSGKYGKAGETGSTYQNVFWDEFLSMVEGPGAFFGNRSVVLHFANKTRIACANFELKNPGVDFDGGECSTAVPGAGGNATTTLTGPATGTTAPAVTDSETATADPEQASGTATPTAADDSEETQTPIAVSGAASFPDSISLLTAASISLSVLLSL
ncbi:uncharacterized protein MKZ38_005889 [Zalerion maritima]|uniref:superoxide dismutase n=1 Tax=Zalerion maritima TaxID=339359 RepID=A0AAD5WQ02_9PEZI|nr:uncharacterized protein MKZ38_005889 [Zalerion maritima]